jgi:hypothetical protein
MHARCAPTPRTSPGALRDDETLKRLYAGAFGHAPPTDDETALVDAGKALAAYQETLASERTTVRCLPRCAAARRRRCSASAIRSPRSAA